MRIQKLHLTAAGGRQMQEIAGVDLQAALESAVSAFFQPVTEPFCEPAIHVTSEASQWAVEFAFRMAAWDAARGRGAVKKSTSFPYVFAGVENEMGRFAIVGDTKTYGDAKMGTTLALLGEPR